MMQPLRSDSDERLADMAAQYDSNSERIAVLEEQVRNTREKIDDLRRTVEERTGGLAKQNAETGEKVDEMYRLLMEAKGAKRTLQAAIILVAGSAGFFSGKVGAAILNFVGVR